MSAVSEHLFYEAFKRELDTVTIKADDPAAAVVGWCLRAAKRANDKTVPFVEVALAAVKERGEASEALADRLAEALRDLWNCLPENVQREVPTAVYLQMRSVGAEYDANRNPR